MSKLRRPAETKRNNHGPETWKLDIVNRKGDKLCDAFGCRRHRHLIPAFGGIFCDRHLQELSVIRSRITHNGDDLDARLEEIRFRKVLCYSHATYAAALENNASHSSY